MKNPYQENKIEKPKEAEKENKPDRLPEPGKEILKKRY